MKRFFNTALVLAMIAFSWYLWHKPRLREATRPLDIVTVNLDPLFQESAVDDAPHMQHVVDTLILPLRRALHDSVSMEVRFPTRQLRIQEPILWPGWIKNLALYGGRWLPIDGVDYCRKDFLIFDFDDTNWDEVSIGESASFQP